MLHTSPQAMIPHPVPWVCSLQCRQWKRGEENCRSEDWVKMKKLPVLKSSFQRSSFPSDPTPPAANRALKLPQVWSGFNLGLKEPASKKDIFNLHQVRDSVLSHCQGRAGHCDLTLTCPCFCPVWTWPAELPLQKPLVPQRHLVSRKALQS